MYQIVINDSSDAKKQNISFRNNAENTKPNVCLLFESLGHFPEIFVRARLHTKCSRKVSNDNFRDAFGLNLYPEYIYVTAKNDDYG